MRDTPILAGDHAQEFLVPHLSRTEQHLRESLRQFDPRAEAQIHAAADLCLPHDVIRLAGGFATGCLITWSCSEPIIPVDTTVNIDTSSIFWLSEDAPLSSDRVSWLRERIEQESSYEWNFHKGNHFISYCRRRSDGHPALVIHSNEKEFKYQFNGLMPVDGNWFMDDVLVHRRGGRYLRLLSGLKAQTFYDIARLMEPYNVTRHRFVANLLLDGRAEVQEEFHKHHYFMPTAQSVAIGCFLCKPGEVVPMFSYRGGDIHLFEPAGGGYNQVRIGNEDYLIVPHGWGKTMDRPIDAVYDEHLLTINGQSFPVRPKATIGVHPELKVRQFDPDPSSPLSLFSRMAHHTPGQVVETLEQVCSYSKPGFVDHGD